MKKIICKREYNTDTAKVVKKVTSGVYGDSCGYEETLYVTEDGFYFLYTNGGEDSIHPEEAIKRMSEANARKWLENN